MFTSCLSLRTGNCTSLNGSTPHYSMECCGGPTQGQVRRVTPRVGSRWERARQGQRHESEGNRAKRFGKNAESRVQVLILQPFLVAGASEAHGPSKAHRALQSSSMTVLGSRHFSLNHWSSCPLGLG